MVAPMLVRISAMTVTSRIWGTLSRITGPGVTRVAAMRGRMEFLLPEI